LSIVNTPESVQDILLIDVKNGTFVNYTRCKLIFEGH